MAPAISSMLLDLELSEVRGSILTPLILLCSGIEGRALAGVCGLRHLWGLQSHAAAPDRARRFPFPSIKVRDRLGVTVDAAKYFLS